MGKINKGILGGFNGKNLRQECLMVNAESLAAPALKVFRVKSFLFRFPTACSS